MRSLVADIFHSLSRNSSIASSPNSSFCGPSATRIGPVVAAGKIDPAFGAALAAATPNSSPACNGRGKGLPRPTRAFTEKLPNIGSPAKATLDREIAEGAALRHAELQRLAIGDGRGRSPGPPCVRQSRRCAAHLKAPHEPRPPRALNAAPYGPISIAGANSVFPARQLAAASASRSIAPLGVRPKRWAPKRPPSCTELAGPIDEMMSLVPPI